MTTDKQALIARYIERDPRQPGPVRARLVDSGVAVWALVGYYQAVGDIDTVAHDYDVPREAVEAALAYYEQHQAAIDARLDEHAAFFE